MDRLGNYTIPFAVLGAVSLKTVLLSIILVISTKLNDRRNKSYDVTIDQSMRT